MTAFRAQSLDAAACVLLFMQACALALSPDWGLRVVHLWGLAGGAVMIAYALARRRRPGTPPAPSTPHDGRAWMAAAVLGYGGALVWSTLANLPLHNDHAALHEAICAVGVLAFAATQRRHADAWLLGCVCGAILMAGLSCREVFLLGAERARGYHFWVSWGALGITMGALPLSAQMPGWQTGWRGALTWVGMLSGIVTAALSGSRLVWLAAAAVLLWRTGRRSSRSLKLALACAAGALFISLLIPAGLHRWMMFVSDLRHFTAGDADNSTGLRLIMWREAVSAWLTHPWLGTSPAGFRAWLAEAAHTGRGPATLLLHGHAHNEVLNALAMYGFVGLIATLALFGLPWRIFSLAEANAADAMGQAAARAGKTLILFYALIGLGDTMLIHRFLLAWYLSVVMLMLGFLPPQQAEREAA